MRVLGISFIPLQSHGVGTRPPHEFRGLLEPFIVQQALLIERVSPR